VSRILFVVILLLSAGCRPSAQPQGAAAPPRSDARANVAPPWAAREPIDAKEAVRIAEQFVRENGYTDFVPPDPATLQPEGIEDSDRDRWLATRANTLAPSARGVRRGALDDPKGWTAGFAYVKPLEDANIGRAVTMDEFGEQVRMQHQGFMLNFLDAGAR
jgi:hypothetical protein